MYLHLRICVGRVTSGQAVCEASSSGIYAHLYLDTFANSGAGVRSVLPGKEAGDVNQKNSDNTKKLERVEEAMRSFMAFNASAVPGGWAICREHGGFRDRGRPTPAPAPSPAARWGRMRKRPILSAAHPTRSLGLPDD